MFNFHSVNIRKVGLADCFFSISNEQNPTLIPELRRPMFGDPLREIIKSFECALHSSTTKSIARGYIKFSDCCFVIKTPFT